MILRNNTRKYLYGDADGRKAVRKITKCMTNIANGYGNTGRTGQYMYAIRVLVKWASIGRSRTGHSCCGRRDGRRGMDKHCAIQTRLWRCCTCRFP
ncbi:Ribonucleoside-diphosphate reductase large subunit [Dirofilaria immitis]